MTAVLLTGHGGTEMLNYRTDVPVPTPGAGEILVNDTAAGINNTDINTRTAWYSKSVSEATKEGGTIGFEQSDATDASWSGVPMQFSPNQGADACGRIVVVGGC